MALLPFETGHFKHGENEQQRPYYQGDFSMMMVQLRENWQFQKYFWHSDLFY